MMYVLLYTVRFYHTRYVRIMVILAFNRVVAPSSREAYLLPV